MSRVSPLFLDGWWWMLCDTALGAVSSSDCLLQGHSAGGIFWDLLAMLKGHQTRPVRQTLGCVAVVFVVCLVFLCFENFSRSRSLLRGVWGCMCPQRCACSVAPVPARILLLTMLVCVCTLWVLADCSSRVEVRAQYVIKPQPREHSGVFSAGL
mgnify:CR=1 FL=1